MITKEKIAFIINPKAGKKSKANIEELVEKNLRADLWKPKFFYTRYSGHAKELVYECIERGYQTIVAAGGDGTVNEVATSVFKTGVTLGIVPIGSGNGLARSLGIPLQKDDAINLLNFKNTREIDVGAINKHYFFCTCGTGFDARIGHRFSKSKARGFISYIKTTILEYNKYRPKKYKLKIDNRKITQKAFLITIANAGQYGNNAYIAPEAEIDDGSFDITILKPFPWYVTPILGIRLFSKNINKSKFIDTYYGHTIEFLKKKKYRFHIDGEPVKYNG
jgi:YegS/Rv2252/BmrU family lipid kinase